jgi:hypothetical protein
VSFILVNASLPWLAASRRTPARGAARAVEVLVPTIAVLLCGWLLLHAGATSVIVVLGLAAVMFALTAARRAPGPSPVPRLEQTP